MHIQTLLKYLLRQFIPVWDYSNVERMLAAMGFTTLLVNLESQKWVGATKNYVEREVEKVVHYFVHADKVKTDSSMNKGKGQQTITVDQNIYGCIVNIAAVYRTDVLSIRRRKPLTLGGSVKNRA